MGKHIIFVITISIFFFSCQKKKIEFEIRKEFMPYFQTDIDLKSVDSVYLIKSYRSELKDSSNVCIKYKFPNPEGGTKWRFMICDSFEVNYDYKISIKSGNENFVYQFRNIKYDTVRKYGGYLWDTKSYYLNGKLYQSDDANYLLPKK